MNRRQMLGVGAAGLLAAAPCGSAMGASKKSGLRKFTNEEFYKNGEFDAEAGKKAFYELFEYHGYSLGDSLKENANFWVADFKQKDFARVGMGGIFWVNDKEHGYFAHEIYLLPGQMIVEHAHVPAEGKPAKHEAWHVRHGSIFNFGEGDEKVKCAFDLPKSQDGHITTKCQALLGLGDFAALNRIEAPHFMMGGPEGAIVSEYASYHSNDGLRFTNPTVAF